MKEKKTKTGRPFNVTEKPKTPKWYLAPIEWFVSLWMRIPVAGGKITKHGCEELKPPYLLLCNHASSIDFPIACLATFPHRTNWVISIEIFAHFEWIIRAIGGIYKRKFTSDLTVVRHILEVLKKRKRILTMYPEARYSPCGINERLDDSLGKLVKAAGCPVAVLIEKGNYIRNPQWNQKHKFNVPVVADMYCIVTSEEAKTLSADEIQKRIEEKFVYDDYRYQAENKIRIKSRHRADNIHRILYKCPCCMKENMYGMGINVSCLECGAKWEVSEYGQLHRTDGEEKFTHIPDWYRWERQCVREEVRSGNYHFEDTVRLEHMQNGRLGFKVIGKVRLTHDYNGFSMDGTLDSGEEFHFNRSSLSMYSVHIEFTYKKKGSCIDLATEKDTYFAYPLNAANPLLKLHLATEELYYMFDEQRKAGLRANQ